MRKPLFETGFMESVRTCEDIRRFSNHEILQADGALVQEVLLYIGFGQSDTLDSLLAIMGTHILGDLLAHEIHLKTESHHTDKQEEPEHLSGDRILIRVGSIPIHLWIVWIDRRLWIDRSLGYRLWMIMMIMSRGGWVCLDRL